MRELNIDAVEEVHGSRRGFLAGTLVGGVAIVAGAAGCTTQGDTSSMTTARELADLRALYSNPERAPLEHVRGPRMGREVLNRLNFSRQQTTDARVIAQIDHIRQAVALGDRLVRENVIACW